MAILDALQVNRQWNYAWGVKYDRFTENGRTWVASRNMLSNCVYNEDNDESLLTSITSPRRWRTNRSERRTYGEDGFKMTWGDQYEFARFNNRTVSQRYLFLQDTLVTVDFNSAFDLHKYGAFLQASKPFAEGRVTLSGGLRLDGNEVNAEMANPLRQLSPRVALRWSVAPKVSVNANVGRYFQLPSYLILGYAEGGRRVNQPDARYLRCDQAAGIRYDWTEKNTTLGLEGFARA